MLLPYLELSAGVIVVLFVVTQIVIPALRDTPLFPFLRTEKHLVSDLQRAHEAVLEEALRTKIDRRQQEAERLRRQRTGSHTKSAEVPQTTKATENR